MPYHTDRVSTNFTFKEATCRCGCGYVRINDLLVEKLERLRAYLGHKPITVHSWCRCEAHNKKVRGVPQSQHMTGHAVDISVKGVSVREVVQAAELIGFHYVQMYLDDGFVHLDVRGYKL